MEQYLKIHTYLPQAALNQSKEEINVMLQDPQKYGGISKVKLLQEKFEGLKLVYIKLDQQIQEIEAQRKNVPDIPDELKEDLPKRFLNFFTNPIEISKEKSEEIKRMLGIPNNSILEICEFSLDSNLNGSILSENEKAYYKRLATDPQAIIDEFMKKRPNLKFFLEDDIGEEDENVKKWFQKLIETGATESIVFRELITCFLAKINGATALIDLINDDYNNSDPNLCKILLLKISEGPSAGGRYGIDLNSQNLADRLLTFFSQKPPKKDEPLFNFLPPDWYTLFHEFGHNVSSLLWYIRGMHDETSDLVAPQLIRWTVNQANFFPAMRVRLINHIEDKLKRIYEAKGRVSQEDICSIAEECRRIINIVPKILEQNPNDEFWCDAKNLDELYDPSGLDDRSFRAMLNNSNGDDDVDLEQFWKNRLDSTLRNLKAFIWLLNPRENSLQMFSGDWYEISQIIGLNLFRDEETNKYVLVVNKLSDAAMSIKHGLSIRCDHKYIYEKNPNVFRFQQELLTPKFPKRMYEILLELYGSDLESYLKSFPYIVGEVDERAEPNITSENSNPIKESDVLRLLGIENLERLVLDAAKNIKARTES